MTNVEQKPESRTRPQTGESLLRTRTSGGKHATGAADGAARYIRTLCLLLAMALLTGGTAWGQPRIRGSVYGGGALANTNTSNGTTTVTLTGGTIEGDVYGGGLGDGDTEALVYGDVTVKLNGTDPTDPATWVADEKRGCAVKGSVFGCNNVNGTPKGNVSVYVFKTQNEAATRITNAEGEPKTKGTYDVKAVYGGGNQAAYEPGTPKTEDHAEGSTTQVYIYGCDQTSIEYVYGGGNAAPVPETNVSVYGSYEIGYVFGGGNGAGYMDEEKTIPNPGADVGLRALDSGTAYPKDDTKETYGTGGANTNILGGTIHNIFGGSNTKGNIVGTATLNIDDAGDCTITADEMFGFGNVATMDGKALMHIGCLEGNLEALYGGAKKADVNSDITLNINSGTFGRVFGGNQEGGEVRGTITVNIEETGCQRINIGELYGGGDKAAYDATPYGGNYPQVNIISCEKIGTVYGGGYGKEATVTGNPHVNINMGRGQLAGTTEKLSLGQVGTVYGGGNAAPVVGNTYVNIGSEKGKSAQITGNVYGGGNEADVSGATYVQVGEKDNN